MKTERLDPYNGSLLDAVNVLENDLEENSAEYMVYKGVLGDRLSQELDKNAYSEAGQFLNEEDFEGPLADIFVSEEEYEKQMENQKEEQVEREIDSDSVSPSQIFNSKFYKLTDEEQSQKLTDYLAKPHTVGIEIETKLAKPHRDNCAAVRMVEQSDWDNAWTFAKAETIHREYDEEQDEWSDTIKTEHEGSRQFVVLKCNDTECDARLRVDSKQLLKFITKLALNDRK